MRATIGVSACEAGQENQHLPTVLLQKKSAFLRLGQGVIDTGNLLLGKFKRYTCIYVSNRS